MNEMTKKISDETIKKLVPEYLILGVIGIVFHFLYQSLTRNYASKIEAILYFSIFTVIFSYLIFSTIRTISASRLTSTRRFLTGKILSETSVEKNIIKELSSLMVLVVLLVIFIASALRLGTYLKLQNLIEKETNGISIHSKFSDFQPDDNIQWAIIINLLSDYSDNETLVFANDLSSSIKLEKLELGLPIKVMANVRKENFDSLLSVYDGVYEISGTFNKDNANILVNSLKNKNPLMELYDAIGIDTEQLDSLENMKLITKLKKIKSSDKDPTENEYNLRIGVPNEIKYFIYSTISGVLLKRYRNYSEKNDTIIMDLNLRELAYVEKILLKTESLLPKKVNFFGLNPMIRKDINASGLYNNIANLYLLKARFYFNSINNKSESLLSNSLSKAMENLKIAKKHLDKSVKYLKKSSISNDGDYITNRFNYLIYKQSLDIIKLNEIKNELYRLNVQNPFKGVAGGSSRNSDGVVIPPLNKIPSKSMVSEYTARMEKLLNKMKKIRNSLYEWTIDYSELETEIENSDVSLILVLFKQKTQKIVENNERIIKSADVSIAKLESTIKTMNVAKEKLR